MSVFRCLWGLGLGDRSILVYAYILMYYTKNRGFENEGFKPDGRRTTGGGRQKLFLAGIGGLIPIA